MRFSRASYSIQESATNVVITVVSPAGGIGTVAFATSDGSATAGLDYTATNGVLTFTGGVVSSSFTVALLGNPISSDETINLSLTNTTGFLTLGSPSTAVLTLIAPTVPTPTGSVTFTQAAYSIDKVVTNIVIDVAVTGDGTGTVQFATSDGSATAGVNYIATNGVLTFASGVVSSSFTVAILGETAIGSNETVNLTLSNPTGELTLVSPSQAVLTLLETNAPEVQFSTPQFDVLRNARTARITVLRLGQTTGTATVAYAASAGTATNGVDFQSTSGTLNFAPGDVTKSFSFPVVDHRRFETNVTVNLVLSNAGGATLGSLSNAIALLVNYHPQLVTLTDSDHDSITLTLLNAGMFTPAQTNDVLNLDLSGTDATSLLLLRVRKASGGDGFVKIGHIFGEGGCRLIDISSADLVQEDIQLGGYLGQLRVRDILSNATVSADGNAPQRSFIFAHDIPGATSIALGSNLSLLQAARLGTNSSITAASLGTLLLHGDPRNHIPGTCLATNISLSGQGMPSYGPTLGLLSVSGAISNTVIAVANGGIGEIVAAQMIDSAVFLGFTPTDSTNPLAGGTFTPDLRIHTVWLTAPTNALVNTVFAASVIGNFLFRSVKVDNGGGPFGVFAGQQIYVVRAINPPFRWNLTGANDQSLGDFHVKQ